MNLPTLRPIYPEIPFTFRRAVVQTAWKEYTEQGEKLRIRAEVRFDDECKNGRRSLAITADIQRSTGSGWSFDSGGCCHKEIAKHFPGLVFAIPFHLCSTDGPMHYVANTVYTAGDRDHNGLRKGESRQLRKWGKTPSWKLSECNLPTYVDGDTCPPETVVVRYVPLMIEGEGKERQLDVARECAIWSEATDEELSVPPEILTAALNARLPALVVRFRAVIESLGFSWEMEEGG